MGTLISRLTETLSGLQAELRASEDYYIIGGPVWVNGAETGVRRITWEDIPTRVRNLPDCPVNMYHTLGRCSTLEDKDNMVNLESLAETMQQVSWHGRYFSCLCPFHEDSDPSLLVYSDGAYCLGCRKRVYLEELAGKKANKGKPRNRMWLDWNPYFENKESFLYECNHTLLNFPHLQSDLKARGFDSTDIKHHLIGYYDGWYTIPIRSKTGEFAGAVLRASNAVQKATGERYLIPPGQGELLYDPHWGRTLRCFLYVVYGILDALSLAKVGNYAVTSTAGKGLSPEILYPNYDYRIIPDRGEEGAAYNLASKLSIDSRVMRLDYPEGCKDPNDMYLRLGRTGFIDWYQNG